MVSLTFDHPLPPHFHKGKVADDAMWRRWSGARIAELWRAIALLCAVDPAPLTLRKAQSVNYISWRLELAVNELSHGILNPLVKFPEEPRRSIVRFDDVRRWAQFNLIGVPRGYPEGGDPTDLRLMDAQTTAQPREPVQQEAIHVLAPRAEVKSPPPELAEVPKPRRRRAKPSGASEYMRESELLDALPFSRATLWRRVKVGKFPSPIKLGENMNAWKRVDVMKWSETVQAGPEKKNGKRS